MINLAGSRRFMSVAAQSMLLGWAVSVTAALSVAGCGGQTTGIGTGGDVASADLSSRSSEGGTGGGNDMAVALDLSSSAEQDDFAMASGVDGGDDGAPIDGTAGSVDLSRAKADLARARADLSGDMATPVIPCASAGDCSPPLGYCNLAAANPICVGCLGNGNCPLGKTCDSTNSCSPGCTATHACPSPQKCDVAASVCGTCVTNADCSGGTASCDPASHSCVACLLNTSTTTDNCPAGNHCEDNGGTYSCVLNPPCSSDADCTNPAAPSCDLTTMTCVTCSMDSQCPAGKVCKSDSCVAGCSPTHACPSGSSCCSSKCIDATSDPKNCGSCGIACSPGSLCCGSSCSNPNIDVNNCSACGMVCKLQHGTPSCASKSCAIASCATGYADCDGQYITDCEVDTTSDANNCGGCGVACSIANAVSACTPTGPQGGGECTVGTCNTGFADCDGNPTNGCETDITSEAMNCGGCNTICNLANANASCVAGVCKINNNCLAGYMDCNATDADGCEVDVNTDASNCSICGMACPSMGGAPTCNAGMCDIYCGMNAAGDQLGDCDLDTTNGCEADVTNGDPNNCGACKLRCSNNNISTPACDSAICDGACDPGFFDCDGNKLLDGCEINILSDPRNCSACSVACSNQHITTPLCGTGVCNGSCDANYADCNMNKQTDGCEVSISDDALNCSACGLQCSSINISSPTCSDGTCNGVCDAGFADCDLNKFGNGCEIDTTSDVMNCGACGAVCSGLGITVATCTAGQCDGLCLPNFGDCDGDKLYDGCEVDLLTDAANCGSCGKACSNNNIGSPICSGGFCAGSCNPGYQDCDMNEQTNGCETHTDVDVLNCGGCTPSGGSAFQCSNNHIATPTCSTGVCGGICDSGFGDCNANKLADGCETNLLSDPMNCNGCGIVCSTTNILNATCINGVCGGPCAPGFADCDGSAANGCETNTNSDPDHCGVGAGACTKVCSTLNILAPACTAGICTGACVSGYADCNNNKFTDGCEVVVLSDKLNCGGCGNVCSSQNISSPSCSANVCNGTCNSGYADCNNNKLSDGCEINISAVLGDPFNCGACGQQCSPANISVRACSSGQCSGTCNAGFADCNNDKLSDGCEANLSTDANNCGACLAACSNANVVAATCAGSNCTSACAAGYTDCNANKRTDGCEVHTAGDPSNCGACGTVCSGTNMATVTCGGGVCNGSCASGWADCDGNKQTNGCEKNITSGGSDPLNCGGCGIVCSSNNIPTPTCSGGACNGTCTAGYADCNSNKATDGCEIRINNTDVNNCGACGTVCSTNHITQTCAAGVCTGACTAGFADCDANKQTDGCETQINAADVNNCGACARVCSTSHITQICTAGACAGACAAGYGDCDANKQTNGCETQTNGSDVNNCGGCATVCSPSHITPTCTAGLCNGACAAGYSDCDSNKQTNGCETQTSGSDVNNCGGCGTMCSTNHVTQACTAGACSGACASGYGDCNSNKQTDGCELLIGGSDVNNCGGCATMCSTSHITQTCTAGVCNGACASGFADCNANKQTDGCEIQTSADVNNCGACGTVCSPAHLTQACSGGLCNGTCAAGYADCNGNKQTDGCETNLLGSDVNNCGGCGVVCSNSHMATVVCSAGVCVGTCAAGYGDCDSNKQTNGCEANLTNSDSQVSAAINHCGTCGGACAVGAQVAATSCSASACVISSCVSGYSDCNATYSDGCEAHTTSDASNCGGCGIGCSSNHVSPVCTSSACAGTCTAGYGDCDSNKQSDGCEANLTNSDGQVSGAINHCGSCGGTCALGTNVTGTTCAGSACSISSCAGGYSNCNGTYSDGCEVNTTTDANNCGGCGVSCSSSNISRACSGSSCNAGTCTAGYTDCNGNKQSDGCEVYTSGDVSNCGGCGTVCSANNISRAWSGGSCSAGTCTAGYSDCNGNKQSDGCETYTTGDVSNCGGCGTICSANNISRACSGGSCSAGTCTAGYSDCNGNKQSDGCEANTSSDVNNCGGCGTVCSSSNITRACSGSSCSAGTCTAGYADCNSNKQSDGCEVSTGSDVNNCGGCGTVCSTSNITRACSGGSCSAGTCTAGWSDCDGNKQSNGCEVNTGGSNLNNCGGCGVVCNHAYCLTMGCSGVMGCSAGVCNCSGCT